MKEKFVQIGSGLSTGPSWISFDSSPTLVISKIPLLGRPLLGLLKGPRWPLDIQYGDIVRGLPLPDNSCGLIFCSHTLEHLSLSDFKAAQKNIFNHLKFGGIFRCIVPDLEAYARNYLQKIKMKDESGSAAINFMRNTSLGCENSRSGFWARLREAVSNSRHQWMWDKQTLIEFLASQGFKDIQQRNFGEWASPHFEEIETPERHIDSICLECRK